MEGAEGSPLRISCTVRALSSALRGDLEADAGSQRSPLGRSSSAGPGGLWFKESSAKNLRSRDFLAPAAVLKKLYPDGQGPRARDWTGLDPLAAPRREADSAELRAAGSGGVVVEEYTDGGVEEFSVSLCPVLEEGSDIISFLRLLGVDWPTVSTGWTNRETEQALWEALLKSPYAEEAGAGDLEAAGGASSEKVGRRIRVDIRRVIQEQRLQGYDPSLTTCLVLQDSVAHLAQLEGALSRCQAAACTVLHIAGSPGEFRQQQLAVLWQALGLRAPGGPGVRQRLLLCGPVQTSGSDSELSACQYLQVSDCEPRLYPQMPEASQLDFTCLKEEGEWLLLFNYIIPFLELLEQSGQALGELGREAGPRISLGTEAVCKFLVSLSMDFSSYYNRVHILGVSEAGQRLPLCCDLAQPLVRLLALLCVPSPVSVRPSRPSLSPLTVPVPPAHLQAVSHADGPEERG
nr:PREDICTED: DALR anticodon-binding domain-containing protein 3 [Lepisosteus oculatus]